MQQAEEHGLPGESLRGDLKELVSSGKLLERMDFKGEPRWAKDVTFKAFGETRTNAQLMAWRQQSAYWSSISQISDICLVYI